MTEQQTPLRNVSVTAPVSTCLACTQPLPPGRARQYCNDRCRQSGWRRRNKTSPDPAPLPAAKSQRTANVYLCPECDTRYLGEQRCADCNSFCQRLGPGGPSPCCEELITVEELLQT